MSGLDIKFRRKDVGDCPYFDYKNTRYLIRDKLDHNEKWVYYLAKKDKREEIKKFKMHKMARDYVENLPNTRYKGSIEGEKKYLYEDEENYYIINKKTVTIQNKSFPVTMDFDSYYDCLKEAKRIIGEIMEREEPMQLKIRG